MRAKLFAKIIFLVVVSVSAFLIAGCKSKVSLEDDFYKSGLDHLEKQEYSVALHDFRNSINENPSNTDSYIKSAEVLKKKHDYDGAIEILENGKDFASEPQLIYQSLGELYSLKGDYIQAEASFRKSMGSNGSNAKSVEGLAGSLILQSKYEEAEKVLADFGGNKDELARIKYLLAILQAKELDIAKETIDSAGVNLDDYPELGKLNSAIEEAKASEDNKIEDLMNISYVAIDGGDSAYALPLLSEAIKENEYYYGAHMYSGYVYLKIGQFDKAKDFLLKAVSLDSKNKDVLKFLAECYVGLNAQKDAIDTYNSLVSLAPKDSEVRKSYIDALLKFDTKDKAKEQTVALIGIDASISNRILLTKISLKLEDFASANEQITLASGSEEYKTAKDDLKAEVLSYKGWILYEEGEKAAGLETLEQSLRLIETNPLTHLYLGIVLKETEEPVDAKTHLERAIDLDFSGEISNEARKELNSLN